MFVPIEDANSPDYVAFWTALKSGEFQASEFKRISKDGSDIWIYGTYTPILDHKGRPFKVVKFASNITQTVASRNQLKDSENRTRTILDTVQDGIITIDALGTIENFNPAAERLFGYTVSEVAGKNVNMLMPEPFHSNHDNYLKNFMDGGDPKVIGQGREVIGRRKDGATFPMELAVNEMFN